MVKEIKFYNINTDTYETLTQEKFDEFIRFVHTIGQLQRKIEDDRQVSVGFDFNLAVYTNPMRDDGVFVAEDRPIEAYDGIRNLDGSPCYPTRPQHGYAIGAQLPHAFAFELVRRWNAWSGGEGTK